MSYMRLTYGSRGRLLTARFFKWHSSSPQAHKSYSQQAQFLRKWLFSQSVSTRALATTYGSVGRRLCALKEGTHAFGNVLGCQEREAVADRLEHVREGHVARQLEFFWQ